MSTTTTFAGIRHQPQFKELVRRRRRFVALLTAMTLLPYYAFILVAAFVPAALAQKLSDASIINVGWPVGGALIVGTWLLTGIYIHRANREFDELITEILARAK